MLRRIAGVFGFSLLMATASVHAQDKKPVDPRVAKASEEINMAVQRCWNRPDYKGRAPTVTLKVLLAKDGSLVGKPEILKPQKGRAFNSMAESAVRAIMRCAPFSAVAENPDLYEDLKKIEMSFHSPVN